MKNFLEIDNPPYNKAKYVVLPIPYEATTTYGKGTKNGPSAILSASQQIELYDIELDCEPCEVGIHTLNGLHCTVSNAQKKIYSAVSKILSDGKFPILLGGEHSITPAAVKACKEKYEDFSVLQFDAHADLYDSYKGSKFNHACVIRRVLEVAPTVQVGIRTLNIEEAKYAKESKQMSKIHFAEDFRNTPHLNVGIGKILSQLSKHIYITFDVDTFDPAVMPSTGTPEPGGLFWYQVLEILKAVIREKQVVGFDVVEFAPIKGLIAPDFLVAKLVYKLIGYLAKK